MPVFAFLKHDSKCCPSFQPLVAKEHTKYVHCIKVMWHVDSMLKNFKQTICEAYIKLEKKKKKTNSEEAALNRLTNKSTFCQKKTKPISLPGMIWLHFFFFTIWITREAPDFLFFFFNLNLFDFIFWYILMDYLVRLNIKCH